MTRVIKIHNCVQCPNNGYTNTQVNELCCLAMDIPLIIPDDGIHPNCPLPKQPTIEELKELFDENCIFPNHMTQATFVFTVSKLLGL